MNKKATGWKREAEITTILNSPLTIKSLTCYKWEQHSGTDMHKLAHSEFHNNNQTTYSLWMRNRVQQTGRDQHFSKFANNTYLLWMREQHNERDMQRSAQFWIPQWQSNLTPYVWERNKREQAGRHQLHCGFINIQTTYMLWMRVTE